MVKKEKLRNIFSKMKNSSNLVVLSQGDIDNVTKLGTKTCLKLKKNAEAKGAIILLEGTKNLTLEKLGDMAEKITKPLPNDTQILWSARINEDVRNDKLEVVYVY